MLFMCTESPLACQVCAVSPPQAAGAEKTDVFTVRDGVVAFPTGLALVQELEDVSEVPAPMMVFLCPALSGFLFQVLARQK